MIPAPLGHAWPPGTGWAWRPDLSVPGDTLWPGRAFASGAEVTREVKVFHAGPGEDGIVAPAPAGFALIAQKPPYQVWKRVGPAPSRPPATFDLRAPLPTERLETILPTTDRLGEGHSL